MKIKGAVCYKLVTVIMHHGWGTNQGHHTTSFLDQKQQQWFYAYDEKVPTLPKKRLIMKCSMQVTPVDITRVLQQKLR